MFFSKLASIMALACALVDAVPAESSAGSSFTLQQQASGKKKLRSGPIELKKTYLKYGKAVPENIEAAAAAASQQGSVVARPTQYDREYLSPVKIGTPAKTLMLDFDTGSADLWVFSTLQSSGKTGHTLYAPGKSKTAKKIAGETWGLTYGDGSSASGVVYRDKVVIGGVTVTKQAVEAATSVSTSFATDTAKDGLVGLAFSNDNSGTPQRLQTFFAKAQSSLAAPVFAAYLKHDAAGSYDFGFIDSSKYTGSLTYVPVDPASGFWLFDVSGFTVGSTAYTFSSDIEAIADTGTSIILFPGNAIAVYWDAVTGAENSEAEGGYIFPCSSTLPDLGITIGGVSHTVPGSYLNYAPIDSTTCFGGLQSSDAVGINVLGDVFLASQYVVFDGGNTQIGFAQQA